MKLKNKGKVYPSPSSSNGDNQDGDVFSVLKLLPAAILALASVLSLEDREVLAYMITRSIKTTTNPNPSSISQDSKKKSSKKPPTTTSAAPSAVTHNHKPPIFDFDCFDCYTSYWYRWDSSPNRELIHQVIEAFEDHLSNGEQSKKSTRTKRKDKSGRRVCDKPEMGIFNRNQIAVVQSKIDESESSVFSTDDGLSPVVKPEKAADGDELEEEKVRKRNEEITEVVVPAAAETEDISAISRSPAGVNSHKGLTRKVLPDVLGILNSRLWSLWGPNV